MTCVHRGERLRRVLLPCLRRGKRKPKPVFACAIYGRCLPSVTFSDEQIAWWREQPESKMFALCYGCESFEALE